MNRNKRYLYSQANGRISIYYNTKTGKYKISNITFGINAVGTKSIYLGFITPSKENSHKNTFFIYFIPRFLDRQKTAGKAIKLVIKTILEILGAREIKRMTDNKLYWSIFYE